MRQSTKTVKIFYLENFGSTECYICHKVYVIGFPNTAGMNVIAEEIGARFIQKNVSKLCQLIATSSDCIAAKDVLKDDKDHRCSVM